jgi:hypothetical protein
MADVSKLAVTIKAVNIGILMLTTNFFEWGEDLVCVYPNPHEEWGVFGVFYLTEDQITAYEKTGRGTKGADLFF